VSKVELADVKSFLSDALDRKLREQGRDPLGELADDYDLLLSGLTDSLGLVELVVLTAEHFGREVDFEGLDPEKMTILGPLCAFISEQLNRP
jgi:acyl carrier protein